MTVEYGEFVEHLESPVGLLEITADKQGVRSIFFQEKKTTEGKGNTHTKKAVKELKEYFSGERKNFTVKLNPRGSEFQMRVWEELQKIPHGKTTSYFDLSNRLGDVKAIRAVGTANGKNPISIIIPCHRVVGRNGELTGYAGGLHRKEWLINFEQQFEQKTLFD